VSHACHPPMMLAGEVLADAGVRFERLADALL
jgi:hypothetical protein